MQIGDENVHLVRAVMDEVFGSENFCGQIAYQKTPYATSTLLAPVFDTMLWYGKGKGAVKYKALYLDKPLWDPDSAYRFVDLPDGRTASVASDEGRQAVERGELVPYQSVSLISPGPSSSPQPFAFDGRVFTPPANSHWKTTIDGLAHAATAGRLFATANSLRFKSYLTDLPISILHNIWTDTITGSFTEDKVFIVQTSPKVIARCMAMTTDPGDLVLDPTCGSGTTAVVAEHWGRRWITADTSRVALALARSRLMGARFPYYFLTDSPEGAKLEAELTGVPPATSACSHDVRQGFVYKRVPHVMLKSIANNPDIREGMSRPEIDAAIRRHADTELLYDQPYEDSSRIRVTGPFTVESL